MIKEFFRLEATAGALLAITTILALIMRNSPLADLYGAFLSTKVIIQIGEFALNKPLLLWINDGLMAIFFLLVGLEIKREIVKGQLSTKEKFILPAFAAVGGLAFPALVYSFVNWGDNVAMRGWAIPAATDIAFAMGVVTLLGKRVPEALKVFLVAVAILDDIIAIVIIALFYTDNLSLLSLGFASVAIGILFVLNKKNVTSITPYALTGIFLWACVLKSGVHATLAGVVLAFFIPIEVKNKEGKSPLLELEHALHPWVACGVLPLFAFANAGVSLKGLSIELLTQPISLGIILGLFFGKQLGVMILTAFAIFTKLCKLPNNCNWLQYYGISLITGIGFTMSLFIGTLAFNDIEYQTIVRLGVLCGSLLSGLAGCFILSLSSKKQEAPTISMIIETD
jgi:NhaA family Na+:H+ antiporter